MRKYFRGSTLERFWNYVDKSGDCWIWNGTIDSYGYGRIHIRQSDGTYKSVKAYRFAYNLIKGLIPNGLVLDHLKCENPSCVNPEHLNPTTNRENMLRVHGAIMPSPKRPAKMRGSIATNGICEIHRRPFPCLSCRGRKGGLVSSPAKSRANRLKAKKAAMARWHRKTVEVSK
jgi:hypothetical protein